MRYTKRRMILKVNRLFIMLILCTVIGIGFFWRANTSDVMAASKSFSCNQTSDTKTYTVTVPGTYTFTLSGAKGETAKSTNNSPHSDGGNGYKVTGKIKLDKGAN